MGFFEITSEIDPENSTNLFHIDVVDRLTLPHLGDYDESIPKNRKIYNSHLKYMINICCYRISRKLKHETR
ncbi:unnamed protein product [Gordionus sp. m RMFG-2023]